MGKALATIPPVSASNPAAMLSLPDWLWPAISSVTDLGDSRAVMEGNQVVGRQTTIPAELAPTPEQRSHISRRIAELEAMLQPSETDADEVSKVIGILILSKAASRLDNATVAAKSTSYLIGLDGIPAWAVREAWKRWETGACKTVEDPSRYDFAPSPQALRREAEFVMKVCEGQAVRLSRLLAAVPVEAIPDARMEANARALAQAITEAQLAADPEKPRHARPHTAEDEKRDEATRAYWKQWLIENSPKGDDDATAA